MNPPRNNYNPPPQQQIIVQQQPPPPPQIIYQQAPQPPPMNPVMLQNNPWANPAPQRDQGPFTLGHLHTKLNGYEGEENPYSIFKPEKEFFFQNEVRSVDMTNEQRTLMSLQAQEVDAMRVLNQIPVGTELYRFQMEQYKELSTTRAEIEKIVHEQRLQQIRRNFQRHRRDEDRMWDNERWIDDQRKFIIAARIRKDMGGEITSGQRQYDPNDGFIAHWDYVLGIAQRNNYAQLVFAIFNRGQTVYASKLVDPHDCEVETQNTVRCIIGDSHQIFDIPPNPDSLMIIECQLPFSQKLDENVGRVHSYGWTQMDLFDFQRGLRRGKWKCPLYLGPTDVNITVDQIQNLEPLPGAWVYFRLAYPNDQDFGRQRSLYPDNTMHEYSIPTIHLRNQVGVRPRVENSFQMPSQVEPLPNVTYVRPPSEKPQDNSVMPQAAQPPPPPPPPQQIPRAPSEKAQTPPPQYIQPPDDSQKLGVSVLVHAIGNHISQSQMRVMVGLLQDGQLLTDDNGTSAAFYTSIHNAFETEKRIKVPDNAYIQLFSTTPQFEGMNNKQVGNDVKFQELYLFCRNLPRLHRRNRQEIWLGIQVAQKMHAIDNDQTLNDTTFTQDFENIAWTFVQVIDDNTSRIKNCREVIFPLYRPPIRRPPVDESRSQRIMETIKLTIQGTPYGDQELNQMKQETQKQLEPAEKQKKVREKVKLVQEKKELVLDDSPYIENLQPQFTNKPFEQRQGIDFYIDYLRFMPDKVTAT